MLAVARDWFLGEKPTGIISHGDPTRIPVMSNQVSLRISDPAFDTASLVRWCRDGSSCKAVRADITVLPAPKNVDAPFPLPGEGIRPEEKVVILDISLPESTGHLEIYAGQAQIQVGHYGLETAKAGIWRESIEGEVHSWLMSRRRPEAQWLRPSFSASPHGFAVIVDCTPPAYRDSQMRRWVGSRHWLYSLMSGRKPTIRYRVDALRGGVTVHESRFFPNAQGDIYLHAHSASAPFVSSASQGIDIDIYQDPACPVVVASISTAHGASLAKMVIRYRMAALAWIIGWAAIIMRRCFVITMMSEGELLPDKYGY